MNKVIVKVIFIFFCWAVLGWMVAMLSGCELGYANDMLDEQELSRANRGIPTATELPPGIGEDLPSSPTP
ncbi:MAG: hypothetical protein FWD53_01000 [Phycisphaerales bacterium]|nr:hypothetical protein [Phycisphaerales bacterium]